MIALLLLAFQAQALPPIPAAHDGKMTVLYAPIYCRSRCPPGLYWITIDGRPRISARTVRYITLAKVPMPQRLQGDGVSVEGTVTFGRNADGFTIDAVIVTRRVAEGLWKP